MKVFANEITLWNGGQLPLNYTIDTLWQPHESHPRNPLIAKVFFLAGFIESWGRGYEKISEEFTKAKLEIPRFEEVRGGFMATIKRERFLAIASGQHDDKPDERAVVEDVVDELTERQRLVLKALRAAVVEDGVETALSLSQKIGASQRSVQRDLAILSAKGFIRRVGLDKGGHWEIIK